MCRLLYVLNADVFSVISNLIDIQPPSQALSLRSNEVIPTDFHWIYITVYAKDIARCPWALHWWFTARRLPLDQHLLAKWFITFSHHRSLYFAWLWVKTIHGMYGRFPCFFHSQFFNGPSNSSLFFFCLTEQHSGKLCQFSTAFPPLLIFKNWVKFSGDTNVWRHGLPNFFSHIVALTILKLS